MNDANDVSRLGVLAHLEAGMMQCILCRIMLEGGFPQPHLRERTRASGWCVAQFRTVAGFGSAQLFGFLHL